MVKITQEESLSFGYHWLINCTRCGSGWKEGQSSPIWEVQYMYQKGDGSYCPNCEHQYYNGGR